MKSKDYSKDYQGTNSTLIKNYQEILALIAEHQKVVRWLKQFAAKNHKVVEPLFRKMKELTEIEKQLTSRIKAEVLRIPDTEGEFTDGYGFKKNFSTVVDVEKLLQEAPEVVENYPQYFSVTLKNLNTLISMGALPVEIRDVVTKQNDRPSVSVTFGETFNGPR